MRSTLPALSVAALAFACPLIATAQADTARTIRFVVPFPPGSGTDTSARYFAKKLGEISGERVYVENKPGGNGFIAVQAVLAAPADGTTVFVGSNSTLAVNVALFRKLPYNPQTDFAPLSVMMRSPAIVAVPESSPYKTLRDLIAAAKAQPGKLNHGAGSAGYQLMNEALKERAAVDITNVPFKGASEALTGVASGTVDLAFADITASVELVKSGRIRALAVASDHRAVALPQVPDMTEAGLPGYSAYVWVAAMVSARTPKPIADRLATQIAQIERLPETRAFYEKLGAETMNGGAEELREFQAAEIELWKRLAVKARIEQE